jgi:UDP-N-acetylmuramate dehydrogenase
MVIGSIEQTMSSTDEDVLDRFAGGMGSRCIRDAALGARTTYRVGGPASVLVEVDSLETLRSVHASLVEALGDAGGSVPLLVIGRGSNMLVCDAGFPGIALALAGDFERVVIADTNVLAGGAVGLQALARQTAADGLAGFEWAVGIPGSIGGAVRMNAGGHGSEMADVLARALLFDLVSGTTEWKPAQALGLGYRRSALGPAQVVVEAELRLSRAEREVALGRVADVVHWRRDNQPGGSNAGSVFTNPPGDSAGRLIDQAGLKGARIGSAEVSSKHANFFQADRRGSADDVRALIEMVTERVYERFGVSLVPELRMIGFEGEPLPELNLPASEPSTSTSGLASDLEVGGTEPISDGGSNDVGGDR